ncbi:unnamed protein product [Caenorhabditis auriculariae]|uniref:Uncharacterized protein n=1 Tax=Caenorhabditis auriculariae TaxID=2777116 RepID=A0A8S1GSL0_9PELO|nr:unnamed protein product [Caenorhabditis auriculariae]
MPDLQSNILYLPRLGWYLPIYIDYALLEGRHAVAKHFFLAINLLAVSICAPLALHLTRQFYRSTVIHPSLKLVYVVHFCTYQVFCISSIVCLIYQGQYLIIPKTFPEDLPITIFGAHKIEYQWSQVFFTLVIVIERFVATIRMRKYERSRNISLGVVLCLVQQALGGYLGYLSVTSSLNLFLSFFLLLFLIIPVSLVFVYIYKFNKSQLVRVLSTPFTLSIKYQIIENLYVFKTLNDIVGLSAFCLFSTNILIVASRFIDIGGPYGFWQIIISFLTELIFTTTPVLLIWRLNRNESLRKSVRGKTMARQQEGADHYFKDLQESWK